MCSTSSQSELILPLLQVTSNNKSFSVGVQSPTEINAPRGFAVILRRICQLSLTRITHQVSRAFDLNLLIRRFPIIQINYRDTRPFYQQIKDNVRHLVVSGALKKDDKLPSVRELAASLAINPNTIQRAYRELENEGYIYTLPGKGTFAAEMDHTNQIRQQELLPQFDKIVSELLYLSMPVNELTNRILSLSGRRIQA